MSVVGRSLTEGRQLNYTRSFFIVFIFALNASTITFAAQQKTCDLVFSADQTASALQKINALLPHFFSPRELESATWYQTFTRNVLPAHQNHSDLAVVSIIGGGNAGKSTLFNAIPSLIHNREGMGLNQPISQTGYHAGLTQQMIVSLPAGDQTGKYSKDLDSRFGHLTEWNSPRDTTRPGAGVKVQRLEMPNNISFIDAPDFDSGPAASLQPENFEAAMRVICPSDVLIGVFHLNTYRQQSTIQTIKRVFKEYGKKKMILVLQADESLAPSQNAEAIRQLLLELAIDIYGPNLNNPERFPEHVIGAYHMPYSSQVFRGKEHPVLNPISEFPSFGRLIDHIDKNSAQIRKESVISAERVVLAELRNQVRQRIKTRLANQLFQKGLLVAIENSAKEHLQPFPYGAAVQELRGRFLNKLSPVWRWIHQLGENLAYPWRLAVEAFRKISPTPFKKDQLSQPLKESHQVHDQLSIAMLLLQLREQAVHLIESNETTKPTRDFMEHTRMFHRLFPEESPNESPPNRVPLPRSELLSSEVQERRQKILNTDVRSLTNELSEAVNLAQWSSPENITASDQVEKVIDDAARKPTLYRRIVLRANNGLPMIGSLLGVGTLLYAGAMNSWPLWILAIVGPANLMSQVQQGIIDTYLSTQLNKWFSNLQYEETYHFLQNRVYQNFMGELDLPSESELQELQNALKVLNPEYVPYPLSFEEYYQHRLY